MGTIIMWDVITQDEASPRTEILLQLNPPLYNTSSHRLPFIGQAAIRVGDWKLITGQPNCSLSDEEVKGDISVLLVGCT